MRLRHLVAALALAALCACGGGGSSAPAVTPSAAPTIAPQTVPVTLGFVIPGGSTSSIARTPSYISPATQSFTLAIDSAAPVVYTVAQFCPANACSVSVQVTVGPHTFTLALYGSTNGSGPVLSGGSASTTILANAVNTVTIALSSPSITVTGNPNLLAPGASTVLTFTQPGNTSGFTASGSGVSVVSNGPIAAGAQSFTITAGTTAGLFPIVFTGSNGDALTVPVSVTITVITAT